MEALLIIGFAIGIILLSAGAIIGFLEIVTALNENDITDL